MKHTPEFASWGRDPLMQNFLERIDSLTQVLLTLGKHRDICDSDVGTGYIPVTGSGNLPLDKPWRAILAPYPDTELPGNTRIRLNTFDELLNLRLL
jgi:hypothetical protein